MSTIATFQSAQIVRLYILLVSIDYFWNPTIILILAFDSQVRQAKADKYETRCAGDYFKNWTQKQFLGFSNQQDNESTPMIPDKFKIDAFLILIDISKERLEKQPIQDQLGNPFSPRFHPSFHPNRSRPITKLGCVFPMVISSDFRMGEHRDDDHEEDAPYFKF